MSLFLNPERQAYLRELAQEHSVSPGQMKSELQHLVDTDLLVGDKTGKTIYYKANTKHPLFPELNSMVRKSLGMDHILESIIERLGELERAYLIDDYAKGKDTGIIDLLLVGNINQHNLSDLVTKAEKYVGRKIRTLCMDSVEYEELIKELGKRPSLLLWQKFENNKKG